MENSTGRHRSPVRRHGLAVAAAWVWTIVFVVTVSMAVVAAVVSADTVTWVQP